MRDIDLYDTWCWKLCYGLRDGEFLWGLPAPGKLCCCCCSRRVCAPEQPYVRAFPHQYWSSLPCVLSESDIPITISFFFWPIFAWCISPCVLAFNFPAFHCYTVLPENSIELGVVAFKKKKKTIWSCVLSGKNSPVIIDIFGLVSFILCFYFHFNQYFFFFRFLALMESFVLIFRPPLLIFLYTGLKFIFADSSLSVLPLELLPDYLS